MQAGQCEAGSHAAPGCLPLTGCQDGRAKVACRSDRSIGEDALHVHLRRRVKHTNCWRRRTPRPSLHLSQRCPSGARAGQMASAARRRSMEPLPLSQQGASAAVAAWNGHDGRVACGRRRGASPPRCGSARSRHPASPRSLCSCTGPWQPGSKWEWSESWANGTVRGSARRGRTSERRPLSAAGSHKGAPGTTGGSAGPTPAAARRVAPRPGLVGAAHSPTALHPRGAPAGCCGCGAGGRARRGCPATGRRTCGHTAPPARATRWAPGSAAAGWRAWGSPPAGTRPPTAPGPRLQAGGQGAHRAWGGGFDARQAQHRSTTVSTR